MSILILVLVLVLLLGGGSYFYDAGGAYPYRGYALPGVGTIVIILVALYLLGYLR